MLKNKTMVDSKTMFDFQNKNDAAYIAPRQKSPGELAKKKSREKSPRFSGKEKPPRRGAGV